MPVSSWLEPAVRIRCAELNAGGKMYFKKMEGVEGEIRDWLGRESQSDRDVGMHCCTKYTNSDDAFCCGGS